MSDRVPLFHVDAFADRPFVGNPAAVCLLQRAAPESWMQDVAREMNLSETAFVVPRKGGDYDLRWFTPMTEVDLCGHATLASAHVLWEGRLLAPDRPARFHTRSGVLTATRAGDWIELDMPAAAPVEEPAPPGLAEALGATPTVVGRNALGDLLVELADEIAVRDLAPDFARLETVGVERGVIVTAPGRSEGVDFVSRFFAPGVGLVEDPVTGSAHCALGPYWEARLGRSELVGYQASARGGTVRVRVAGDRVLVGGRAVTVLHGDLIADPEAREPSMRTEGR